MSKILVLGNVGMAGFVISTFLKENGHTVLGYARRKSPTVDTFIGDVKDVSNLSKVIDENNFDFIINCVGVLNQFANEDCENAIFVNAYLPHFLKKKCEHLSTKIIQMSTDCVFSGKKGNYSEKDVTDGESIYDRTKAIGELIDDKNITLRNSIIGPDINPNGIGLFNWFMAQSGEIFGFTNAIWTGLTTTELARVINHVILFQNSISGLTNMVNNSTISKYQLLLRLQSAFARDMVNITPSDDVLIDKSLIRTNNEINYIIPTYDEMIVDMRNWVFSHKQFFPHYF